MVFASAAWLQISWLSYLNHLHKQCPIIDLMGIELRFSLQDGIDKLTF